MRVKEKKQRLVNIIPLILTVFAIYLILFSGFVEALLISLTSEENTYYAGETASFEINVTIQSDEILPIEEVKFSINGPSGFGFECNLPFDENGYNWRTISCGSQSIEVKLETESNLAYGYGYRSVSYGSSYNFGYGYGYKSSLSGQITGFKYRVKWDIPSSNIPAGDYTAKFKIKANSTTFEKTESFTIRHYGMVTTTPRRTPAPSGGAGEAPSGERTEYSLDISHMNAGESKEVDFTTITERGPIMKISFVAGDEINDAKINFRWSYRRIGNAPEPKGKVAFYLVVDKSNIEEGVLQNVKIEFRISREWFEQNNADPEDVALYRYANGNWQELDTRVIRSDAEFYYYEAYSPGFSVFVAMVSEEKETPSETPTITEKPTVTPKVSPTIKKTPSKSPTPKESVPKTTAPITPSETVTPTKKLSKGVIIFVILLIGIILLAYFLVKQEKKREKFVKEEKPNKLKKKRLKKK